MHRTTGAAERAAHWQGVCTAEGHRMRRFVVRATLREMRRHVTTMGQPRVWCEHCNDDTSVRWERASEPVA